MEVTRENMSTAVMMMQEAAEIKNYNTAITLCNELMLIEPNDAIINFYFGYLSTISRDFHATKTFKVLEKQLFKAVELLDTANFTDEQKAELLKEFIEKTLEVVDVYGHKYYVIDTNHFNRYLNHSPESGTYCYLIFNEVCPMFYGIIEKYLTKDLPEGISREWADKIAERMFDKEAKCLDTRLHNTMIDYQSGYFDHMKKEVAEFPASREPDTIMKTNMRAVRSYDSFLDDCDRHARQYGKWLIGSGKITVEELRQSWLKCLEGCKEKYFEYKEKSETQKQALDKMNKLLLKLFAKEQRIEYESNVREVNRLRELMEERYIEAVKELNEYRKYKIKIPDFWNALRSHNSERKEPTPEMKEEAKKVIEEFIINGTIPERLR